MDCKQFNDKLFALHEGEISDELRQSMEEHLSSCTACAKVDAGFNTLAELIEIEKTAEPNPFAATRILQRIDTEFERSGLQSIPVWTRILQPVALALALLTGILIGSYTAKTGNPAANQLADKSEHIELLKSDFFISEFTDEDKILDLNK